MDRTGQQDFWLITGQAFKKNHCKKLVVLLDVVTLVSFIMTTISQELHIGYPLRLCVYLK